MKDEKDLKEIALKVIDLFKNENISPLDALCIMKLIQTAIFETINKEGDKNE